MARSSSIVAEVWFLFCSSYYLNYNSSRLICLTSYWSLSVTVLYFSSLIFFYFHPWITSFTRIPPNPTPTPPAAICPGSCFLVSILELIPRAFAALAFAAASWLERKSTLWFLAVTSSTAACFAFWYSFHLPNFLRCCLYQPSSLIPIGISSSTCLGVPCFFYRVTSDMSANSPSA
jgi:hypothetical protein